jgi:hypothetical protein
MSVITNLIFEEGILFNFHSTRFLAAMYGHHSCYMQNLQKKKKMLGSSNLE